MSEKLLTLIGDLNNLRSQIADLRDNEKALRKELKKEWARAVSRKAKPAKLQDNA
jgi:hypothetical protein